MIQRKTQNLAYWRDEYQVDEADHEFLYETLIDARHLCLWSIWRWLW